MAENIYKLLQGAEETAQTSQASIFGVEVALVTNVNDPQKEGRVKVCLPRLPGKPESGWARVAQPAAGPGRGMYWLPLVGDEVLVGFERGSVSHPYVIGCLWNGKDKPMKNAFNPDNTTRMIQTPSGHHVILEDKNGEEKIIIADSSGKRTVTFDVKAKKFIVEAKEGDVEISAEKKIVLHCEDLEIKSTKTGKVDIGSTFDLVVSDKGALKAGPQMNIKAQRVDLNPSGGAGVASAAAGAAAAAAAGAAAAAASKKAAAKQRAAAGGGAAAAGGRNAIVPTKTVAPSGAPTRGGAAGKPGAGQRATGKQGTGGAAGGHGRTGTAMGATSVTAGSGAGGAGQTATGAPAGASAASQPSAASSRGPGLAKIEKFWSEREGERVKLNWKISKGGFGSAEIRCPGETVSITDRMRSDASGKHGYIHRNPKQDAGGAGSAAYTLRLLGDGPKPSEIASQDLEVKAEASEGEKNWFSFEANEETTIKTIKLAKKKGPYCELVVELELKALGGGFEYDSNEKRDVADYLHEIAEKTPDLLSALKDRFSDFLYDDTSWAEFELEDAGKPELTHASGKGVEAKVNLSLKHLRSGVVLKAEFSVFERDERGEWKFCQLSGGTEWELKIIRDVPFGHGMVWKTPALKAELMGKIQPDWERIFEQVLKNILADVGAASLIELGAAGALIGVMLWATYEELKEAQALESLPSAVPVIHSQLVSVVLDALCKKERPKDEFMGGLYDRAAALADRNIKAKWLKKNSAASEDQYYDQIRSEIDADRDGAIQALNLELRSARDHQRGHLDDTARQLAFVAFARTARRSAALLSDAWVRLFEEPPRGKLPYDPKNPSAKDHFAHDPSLYEEVVKELKAGAQITGDLDKYLATVDDGLIGVGAEMGSAQLGGEIALRIDPLARRYLGIVLDAFAQSQSPTDPDDAVVFEKLGVKLREEMKQRVLADPSAGLDEASFYDGISAEVEKEQREGGGPLRNKLWPHMQELARIVLWFSYARSTDYAQGRRGVWKALFGKWPEDSPNRRLFDQVDDILKYKRL